MQGGQSRDGSGGLSLVLLILAHAQHENELAQDSIVEAGP